LLPTRAWELLIGGISAYFYKTGKYDLPFLNSASITGFALIILSIFLIDKSITFPGVITLLPTSGAALILLYAQNGTYVQRLLSIRSIVGLGLISYSAYLWHQPVIVFARYHIEMNWDTTTISGVILLVFLISALTWKFIEQPFRRTQGIRKNTLFVYFFLVSLLFILFGYFSILNKGYPERFKSNNSAIEKLASITDPYDYFNYKDIVRNGICHSISTDDFHKNGCLDIRKFNLFIIGDSYAASLYPGLRSFRDEAFTELGITQFTEGNAPPFVSKGKGDTGASLSYINQFRIEQIAEHKPNIVLLHWMPGGLNSKISDSEVIKKLEEQISLIKKASPLTEVVIIGPPPKWASSLQKAMITYYTKFKINPPLYMNLGLLNDDFSLDDKLKHNLQDNGILYISLLDILCNNDGCLTHISSDILDLTAVDWGHLTFSSSAYVASRIIPMITIYTLK
jgi:hypothetical protein